MHDEVLADHLYRLAQEAVTNAIKHGHARNITIGLAIVKGGGVLTIRDDGCGFDVVPKSQSGLGLRIMNYRAKMISGSLSVQSSPERRNHGEVLVSDRRSLDQEVHDAT